MVGPIRDIKNYAYVIDKHTGLAGQVSQIEIEEANKNMYIYKQRQSSQSGYLVNILAVYPFTN